MTDAKDAERLAQLEAEVAALKAKVSPPEPKPFVPAPYQRYDPTEGMTMPPSALRAMVDAEPAGMMRDVALRDARAPNNPAMIPSSQQPSSAGGNVGRGTGWVDPLPIGPSPHQRYVDQQIDAQDAKDRRELVEREAKFKAMEKLAQK